MADNEAYEISIVCRNCGYVPVLHGPNFAGDIKNFSVPKGITVKQFLMDMICENCGCEGYMGLLNQPG